MKVINLNENEPIKILYQISLITNAHDNTFNSPLCWGHHIRKILYNHGFGYIWENQNNGIDKYFMTSFKRRMIDSFWQTNNTQIEALSQNRIYRHLTSDSCFYLTTFPNNFIRIAISKLRLGSHHLNIERGRWNNTVLPDRKCTLCNDIEDEFHFVVICVKFYDLRTKYLPKSLYINPSMYKFLNFLNTKNESQLKKLGLFLHFAFNRYTHTEVLN